MRAGLDRALELPLGRGAVEAIVGASAREGAFARLQALYRPWERVGAFGYGQVDRDGWQAGAGVRVTF